MGTSRLKGSSNIHLNSLKEINIDLITYETLLFKAKLIYIYCWSVCPCQVALCVNLGISKLLIQFQTLMIPETIRHNLEIEATL